MITQYAELVQLRFHGERFAGHTLEVEATQELIAYKKLVLDCAKELWRRRNPGRIRLPRRFEEGFSLAFSELKDGSAIVPLMRRIEREDDELPFPVEDEFVQAARLLEDAIDSVGKGEPLPIDLPRNVIPLFRLFGKSLKADESLFVRSAGRNREAAYTASVRQKLATWTESTYEDLLNLTGEVSMANTRGGHFVLTLDSGETPTGRFSPEQEAFVLEALYRHRDVRLRVEGVAEFNEADRSLLGFVHVEKVEIVPAWTIPYDETVRPVWEVLAEIGAKAPSGAWDQLPSDLSMRVDEYLAGNRSKR